MVNLDVLFLLSFFFFPFFAGTQIDAAHFVLIISPFVRDIRRKKKTACNGVPAERGANVALLWGQSCRMDNVMDCCLKRGGWMGGRRGREVLQWWRGGGVGWYKGRQKIEGKERVEAECGAAGSDCRKKRVKHISAVHTHRARTHTHSCGAVVVTI